MKNNLLLTDFYMQDWRLYLYGSFDILLNYSISKVGFFLGGGEVPLEIKNTTFRMNQEISLSAGAANL